MNVKSHSDNLIIREFTASKQVQLFTSLQESQVSGKLTLINPQSGHQWHFYLYLGGIVYGTGGVHPIRRWQRNLISNLPQIPFDVSSLKAELTRNEANLNDNVWEYEQLAIWVEQNIISPQQARKATLFTLIEILFDITQGKEVVGRINQESLLTPELDLIEPEEVIEQTQNIWSDWQTAQATDCLPNLAPIILEPQQLQEKTSISAYQSLCKLLNGNRTLKDLAVQLRTTPLQVTCSLLPYIQSEIFGLVEVPDLLELLAPNNIDIPVDKDRPLIACIDDSMMVSQMMEQIISLGGYRFLGINDPIQAISMLIKNKPDLIFLDIVMPRISGYDLCAQLRKHREFEDIPIIFLTSNNGFIDRIRAKMVGSTDFVKKTVDADDLLSKIVQYLD